MLALDVPAAPEYLQAVEASRHYAGFRYHRFPTCFVCGTQRTRGDGMRGGPGRLLAPHVRVVGANGNDDGDDDGRCGRQHRRRGRPHLASARR